MEILDRPIKKNDILRLAQYDPMVNKAVKMHQKQGLSWEDAMMTAVYYLSKHTDDLFKEIMRLKNYEPIVIIDDNKLLRGESNPQSAVE